jgi:SAM-dependent methyltransferase
MTPSPTNDKERSIRVWENSPAGTIHAPDETPGTMEFFRKVLERRNGYEMPWLLQVVPFGEFAGRTVLEIGCGAGYDAVAFCRHGARYLGFDIVGRNVRIARAHLEHLGLEATFFRADAENVPVREGGVDVVFSNGVLHHTPDILTAFREALRVLRRGGEFWVIIYHRDSIFYWVKLYLWDHLLKRGYRERSFRERLSMIEYTTSDALPLVNVYSRGQLRRLLKEAGFLVRSIRVRKLLREDLPDLPVLWRVWRHIPQRWLDRIGTRFGWYVIAHAVKE